MKKHVMFFSILFSVSITAMSIAQTWTVEKVTDNTESDTDPFAVAVSSGIMVCYTHDDGDNEVFIADNFSGSWASSRITDNTRNDEGLDIAARYNEQTAHITIQWDDTPDREISYYTGTPGNWNTQRVTDDADSDLWPSLALDKNGHAHIAYHKNIGDAEVYYANNVTGSWVSEQVTDNATPDGMPWIALGSDSCPNIVYTDVANLLYTKKAAGIWTSPSIVAPGATFPLTFPFLALDADNKCHVAYAKSDGADYEIYYVNNVTGSWQESKVTSNDYIDAYPTLALDPNKKIHIAYIELDGADAEVFYSNNVSGIWTKARVTDNSVNDMVNTGRYFITDKNRIGHIFFSNNSDGDYEIYHAYSNEPLYATVEEEAPVSSPLCLSLENGVFSSAVRYTIPEAANVSLKIYDVTGSLVRTLVDGMKPEGRHSVSWNGETNEGLSAPKGVYFCSLVANDQTISVKGTLK